MASQALGSKSVCLEGILDPVNLVFSIDAWFDQQGIEAYRILLVLLLVIEKAQSGLDDFLLFSTWDTVGGATKGLAVAILDLDETQVVLFQHDQVDFARPAVIVFCHQP